MIQIKNYIDGKIQGISNDYLSIYNPSTGEIDGEVILSSERDFISAIESSKKIGLTGR